MFVSKLVPISGHAAVHDFPNFSLRDAEISQENDILDNYSAGSRCICFGAIFPDLLSSFDWNDALLQKVIK